MAIGWRLAEQKIEKVGRACFDGTRPTVPRRDNEFSKPAKRGKLNSGEESDRGIGDGVGSGLLERLRV